MAVCRVLLVDDSPIFLQAASRFLGACPEVMVVGQAFSAREALAWGTEPPPDLVLMDLMMQGMTGLEATEQIKARPRSPRVVIVTVHDYPESRAAAAAAGADGFVPKGNLVRDLLPLLRTLFPELDAPHSGSG